LITGAGGFLGRHCLLLLATGADEVHAVVRPGSPPPAGASHVHHADLLDPSSAGVLAAKVQASHLLHLAWVATPGEYWTSPENRTWVDASVRLVRAFVTHGGRRAVLAGTCAEYDWTAGRCRENLTPLRPAGLYGECKNALREQVESFAGAAGLSAVWARLFFLYGPFEHPRRLAPSVIGALLQGHPATCAPGNLRRDFLHAADAAGALVALLRSGVCGNVNIGSGKAVPVRTVVQRLAKLCGRPDLVRLTTPDASAAPLVEADVSRLRSEVGFTPRFRLAEGLTQTVAWWRCKLRENHHAA
jgi:nucleoside-diphosphate-sugar epimerase